jgi:DNA-binding MarR family transcriptional regulator
VLLELVERLGNLMRAEMRKAGADESLQPVHLHSLIYLSKANRYSNTPQALADYLGLTKGTVSQTLLLLDRRGLIERFEDDIDRRVVRLRLSSAGEQLLAESQPALPWQNATRNISPNRIRNATSALREALATLQEDNEGTVFGECSSCSLVPEALAAHLPLRKDGRPPLRPGNRASFAASTRRRSRKPPRAPCGRGRWRREPRRARCRRCACARRSSPSGVRTASASSPISGENDFSVASGKPGRSTPAASAARTARATASWASRKARPFLTR